MTFRRNSKLTGAMLGWSAFVTATLIPPANAATPATLCKKATSAVEREICSAPELLAMDREIAALYDRGLAQSPREERHRLSEAQLAFLKKRKGCDWAAHNSAHPGTAVEECVRGTMDARVHTLRHLVDRTGE